MTAARSKQPPSSTRWERSIWTSCARESTAWEERRALIALDASISSPNGTFTTPEMVALERDNLDLMRAGRGQNPPIAAAEEIRQWATDRGLLADQIEVAQFILTTPDWVTSIEGRAGSAKTTTVGAIREFAEEHGYTVRGFAPTTRAVKALAEAGVESRTVASLIENKIADAGRQELWIVDESSLLATRQVNRLLHKAREAGVERIVFVGDQHQHHAIEAGRPIHQMQQAGMPVARLDTIRRQRDPMLREAVELAAKGEIDRALALLEKHDRIREIQNPEVRYKSIAHEYVAAHEAGERVLVVSPANDERRQLNSAIRELLKQRSHISAEGKEQVIFVNRDLTAAQRQHPQSYEVGDVVRYRRGSRRLGLGKGTYARVEGTDSDLNRITVRTEDGRAVEYNPARLTGVDLFREERRVIANGDRIQFRAPDRALGVVNGEFATVVAIDDRKAALRMDDGREVKAAVSRLRHIDYGYASTSHSSQGATVDRVIVNIDTARSAELVNRKQFYVSISRARHGVTVYTDDSAALRHAVGRTREKSIALERLKLNVGRDLKMVPEPPAPEHHTCPRHQKVTGLAEHCWRIIFSSALRYERGRSDSASFAARPRRALHASRSASRRCQGSARSASNRAAGTPVPDAALGTVAALRHAHLGIQRRPPDSVERAALSKCCALRQLSERPGPSGTRAESQCP